MLGLAIPQTIPFLNWTWDDLIFLVLGGLMLAAAIFVVSARDIIRSGLALILSFAALAGIYVLAGAVIVAAAQVLIYIGAISVLILFAIMLTQTKVGPAALVFHRQAWAGLAAAIGIGFLIITSIVSTQWPGREADRIGISTLEVAHLLFAPLYVVSLQVIAVMLTAAVIGGVFLAKREEGPDPGERAPATLDRIRRVSPPTGQTGGAVAGDRGGMQ